MSDTPPPAWLPRKTIFLSKTFWVQVITILSAFFPMVRDFMKTNPVEFVAVFGAVNIIVRFVTHGAVNIFGENTTPPAGRLMVLAGLLTAAALGGLPSCSPDQLAAARAIPVRVGITTDYGRAGYSSKRGIELEYVMRDSGK